MFLQRETPQGALAEAQRLLRDGSTAGYLAFARNAVERFPEDPGLRLEYAAALSHARDDRASQEALRFAALEPDEDPARLARAAKLLVDLGELSAASSCVQRARAVGSTNLVILNSLNHAEGLIAVREGDHTEAERLLRLAHDGDPANGFITRMLVALLIRDEGDAAAREVLSVIERTLQTEPLSGEEQIRSYLERMRRRVEALLDRGSLKGPEPKAAGANHASSRAFAPHVGLDEPSEHPPALTRALAKARGHLARENWGKYLRVTQRAAAQFPRDAQVRLELATALARSDPARAKAEAVRAVSLDSPDGMMAQAVLLRAARLLLDLGDPRRAEELAEQLDQRHPNEAHILNGLTALRGASAAARGEVSKAERLLSDAHRIDPVDAVAANDLATLLAAQGRSNEALAVIATTFATPQRPGTYQGQATRVLQELRARLEPDPST